jgi:AraC-like DNA-binding protein
MPNRLIFHIVLLFCVALCFSQKNEAGLLLEKANEILYDDPRQAITIGENLIKNPDFPAKAEAAILLAKSHFITGQYAQAVADVQTALAESKNDDKSQTRFDALLLAAEIYSSLELFALAKKNLVDARQIAKNNPALTRRLDAYELFVETPSPNYIACAKCIKGMTPVDLSKNAFISKGTPLQLTARAFQKQLLLDSASVYFEKNAKDLAENRRGAYWRILALIDYSDFHFSAKRYAATIAMLEQALGLGKVMNNPFFVKTIGEKISVAALAQTDQTQFDEFRKKAESAQNDVDTQITQATNLVFENLQQEKTEKIEAAQKSQSRLSIILGLTAIVILMMWLAVRWFFANKTQHLQDIISYLKLIKNIETKREPVVKSGKNLSIPKDTEDLLLTKLEKFESGKKYLTKDFSLAQLAALLDTNTKYLSEVINKYKRKNFNSYTNELRIRYIVEKLKNDPKYLSYKVSYLAEECGFSSHSLFSAAFKTHTGITPNVFIQFLSDDLRRAAEQEQFAQLQ